VRSPFWRAQAGKRPLVRLIALVSVAASTVQGVTAQTLDPATLARLQAQLGTATTGGNAGQQLDAARANGGANVDDSRSDGGVGLLQSRLGEPQQTAEELEVRRERSRLELAREIPASPIEREFQQRLGDPSLRQFGYDLFRTSSGRAGPLTGALSGDYALGIGDELIVTFQGATNRTENARVDREGRLIVGALPPIRAAGRSLSSVRAELAAATRRTLLGTEVNVSVGSVRSISVFVGGEVASPGAYQFTSLADIVSAIAQAGGVRRTGSLRHVRVLRGGASFEIDLYGLLGIGVTASTRLREGDRIIVPVIGPTAAISGGVARPGIYELRGTENIGTLLAYAGGSVRARGSRVSISRIEPDGSEAFVRGTSLATRVIAGDGIQVLGGSAGGAIGRVLLRGYVANPGPRAISASPTVRDLIGGASDLRSGTYLPLAVVIRADPQTGARRFLPINLAAALDGRGPVPLRSEDRVYILSSTDIDFINRASVRQIVLGKRNPQPGCLALERLEVLVRDTQSARYNVITRGTFTTAAGEVAAVGTLLAQRPTLTADRSGNARVATVGATGSEPSVARDAALGATGADTAIGTTTTTTTSRDATTSGVGGGQSARSLDLLENNITCPAVFQEEPELLPVLIENSVSVGGVVRKPGAYPVAGPVEAATLAILAEGLLSRSEGLVLDVTRGEGSGNRIDRVAGLTDGRFPPLIVHAGDDIRFNGAHAQFESGGVLLTGEVARPGLYTIRRGERLSELLARAGGLTSLAYPYGTVFTRRSVQEQQQDGLRRTQRELNEALLSIAARQTSNGGSSASLADAGQFVAGISNVQAIGRVVVEADPRVLTLRPDLDTVLDASDAIFVPKLPTFVLALGDLSNPGALQFIPNKSAGDYIHESGGIRRSADISHAFVVLPNGAAQPLRASFGRKSRTAPPPGSTIIVPKNIDPLYGLSLARDITQIVGQFISSIATVAILAKK